MVWGVSVLAGFAETGRIERASRTWQAIHLLPAMQNTLRDYVQYCKDRLHLRPGTLHRRTMELTIFLDFLHSRKARTLDQIQAARSFRVHLLSGGSSPWKDPSGPLLQPKTVARIVSDMRSFLRFLTMRGILQKDLSAELPKIRVPRDATIPSVWEQELVLRLLERGRSQFGERETRLRHSLTGLPVGIACRRYSHAETRTASLGGFEHRSHASENRYTIDSASDQRSRRSLDRLLEIGASPNSALERSSSK